MLIALVISEVYRPKFQLIYKWCDLNVINQFFHQHVEVLLMFNNSCAFLTVYLFRSTEMDLTMNYGGKTLVEEIIALSAGAFTMTTGALILYMNEKPPRQKTASRVYHIGSCLLAFVSFALLIASLTLFYMKQAADEKTIASRVPLASADAQLRLESQEETLSLLLNTAIVFAFISLFAMTALYILFISSCSTTTMCQDSDTNNSRLQLNLFIFYFCNM